MVHTIRQEYLLPGSTAKYGIEYESIVFDKSIEDDYICITNNEQLFDIRSEKILSDHITYLLFDIEMEDIYNSHVSLNCGKISHGFKRIEFSSVAQDPTLYKPSILFKNLKQIINYFHDWTNKKYFIPDHGTISYYSNYTERVETVVTGGTHITISFPLTKYDHPITWKLFLRIFIGLITFYQPMYIALNGAPSLLTKGSERQRTSGSVMIGSANMYDIFLIDSNRYEIFINSPDITNNDYFHWNDPNIKYKTPPWSMSFKADIGNSLYDRSDIFELYKEEFNDLPISIEYFDNPHSYNLINKVMSQTVNLIEFRFFDNEPAEYLLEKFNLIIRIADYAYNITEEFESKYGINNTIEYYKSLKLDKYKNIRPLCNTKEFHESVSESMKNGINTIYYTDYIKKLSDEISILHQANFFNEIEKTLRQSNERISAVKLHELFINEINRTPRYFSDYFQTDNPTNIFSKEYQINKYDESLKISEKYKSKHLLEKDKKRMEEDEKKIEEQSQQINNVILNHLDNLNPDNHIIKTIKKYVNINYLAHYLRYLIFDAKFSSVQLKKDISNMIEYATKDSLFISNSEKNILITWIKENLIPYLSLKILILNERDSLY